MKIDIVLLFSQILSFFNRSIPVVLMILLLLGKFKANIFTIIKFQVRVLWIIITKFTKSIYKQI